MGLVYAKQIDLSKTEMRKSLSAFYWVNRVNDKLFVNDRRKRLLKAENILHPDRIMTEVALYWAVYHYDDKIPNIVIFQNELKGMVKESSNYAELETKIRGYLQV